MSHLLVLNLMQVLAQFPLPGTVVTDVRVVSILANNSMYVNPKSFVMPDVIGKPVDDVSSFFKGAGLRVSSSQPIDYPGIAQGTVVKQSPPAGYKVSAILQSVYTLASRRFMEKRIAPSILSADFAQIADQIAMVESAGADMIHVDVMDGHFVPNITIGPVVVEWIRKVTSVPLDVHLMIENADRYIEAFVKAGASLISGPF